MRVALIAFLAAGAVLAGAFLAGGAAAAPPDVGTLILTPTQVAAGYVQHSRADGRGVKGSVTLNICGTTYPSEKLRATRLQVDYVKQGTTVGISNEVVTYRGGGAAQAMREVIQRALSCPHHPINSGVTGLPKLTFTITRLSDPRLLKGSLAIRVVVTGTVAGKHIAQTSYAVYQRLGNVLSGVYSFGLTAAGQRALCLHVAEESARNLRNGTNSGNGLTA
jgi:hypothetical protein